MAAVLSTVSQVSCPHQGKVTPLVSAARLTIAGAPVLTTGTTLAPIAGCTVLVSSGPPPTAPCLSATMTSGAATKLKVGGQAVLLAVLSGTTNGQPPAPPAGPPVTASTPQQKLKAI